LKEVLGNTNASKEELESKTKELSDELMKVWQKLYQQPGAEQANAWTTSGSKPDDGVVDGEVETDGNTTRV
jgi:hypothetical protein